MALKITRKPTELTPELEQRIRDRAYELYEQRGREDGHDTEDWLMAEAEILAEVELTTQQQQARAKTV
jgi:hypothetical protein